MSNEVTNTERVPTGVWVTVSNVTSPEAAVQAAQQATGDTSEPVSVQSVGSQTWCQFGVRGSFPDVVCIDGQSGEVTGSFPFPRP